MVTVEENECFLFIIYSTVAYHYLYYLFYIFSLDFTEQKYKKSDVQEFYKKYLNVYSLYYWTV